MRVRSISDHWEWSLSLKLQKKGSFSLESDWTIQLSLPQNQFYIKTNCETCLLLSFHGHTSQGDQVEWQKTQRWFLISINSFSNLTKMTSYSTTYLCMWSEDPGLKANNLAMAKIITVFL